MKIQIIIALYLGKIDLHRRIIKQNITARSNNETELDTGNNGVAEIIWEMIFLEHQEQSEGSKN